MRQKTTGTLQGGGYDCRNGELLKDKEGIWNKVDDHTFSKHFIVGPLQRVRPRNGILALVVVVPLRSEFIGEL